MLRHSLLFAGCFVAGAALVLAFRSARHAPYQPPVPPAPAAPAAASVVGPVNSVCPICGMAVDISLGTAVYQGQVVGFGCRSCPAVFAQEADRYGPLALKNLVAED